MVYELISQITTYLMAGICFTVLPVGIIMTMRYWKLRNKASDEFLRCRMLLLTIAKEGMKFYDEIDDKIANEMMFDLKSLDYFKDPKKKLKLCQIFIDKWEAKIADNEIFKQK